MHVSHLGPSRLSPTSRACASSAIATDAIDPKCFDWMPAPKPGRISEQVSLEHSGGNSSQPRWLPTSFYCQGASAPVQHQGTLPIRYPSRMQAMRTCPGTQAPATSTTARQGHISPEAPLILGQYKRNLSLLRARSHEDRASTNHGIDSHPLSSRWGSAPAEAGIRT